MEETRAQIDEIDRELVVILSKRMKLVLKLGKIKKHEGLAVQNDKREAEILAGVKKLAKKHGLNPLLIKRLYTEIINESKRIQSHEK